ncbi:hypothetical protein [Microvirga thermotolerans]|uniref:Uncharacterized protein n=1 Tax=Microvirga thermotolerans TaxID=2651334 RepID=A0A5P9JU97_9HYPH|nr:hypothetical protein [Microvirga thermotolerans]QFU16003.1 hypothetical protein GDR74_07070 [Microvirga thermotolerans]
MPAVTVSPAVSGINLPSGRTPLARRMIDLLAAGRASAAARQLRPYEAALRELPARYGAPVAAGRPSFDR